MFKALGAVLLLTLAVLVANAQPSHAATAIRAWTGGDGRVQPAAEVAAQGPSRRP